MTRKAELRFRLLSVERMLLRPTAQTAIVEYARSTWGIGRNQTLRLIERVYDRWTVEGERDRPRVKEAQVRRLRQMLGRIHDTYDQSKPDRWLRNVASAVAVERLLADVQGTREPVKIEHDFSRLQAVDGAVASLSPEKFAAAVAEYRREKELASRARVLLKLGDGTEVLQGSAAESIVRRSIP